MTTPLPRRTAANDERIRNTPYEQLTQRQKDYADINGIPLRAPSQPAQQAGGGAWTPGAIADAINNGGTVPQGNPTNGSGGSAPVDSAPSPGPITRDAPYEADTSNLPQQPADDPVARAAQEAKDRANRDAFARLQAILNDYGLGSLSGAIQAWLQDGLSEAEIAQRMRETPEFKARFPAIEERKRRGLSPLSPAEYVAYEKQARQLFRSAGLPQGFYDGNDDFTKFLAGDVSLSELGDRVGLASNAAFNSDASVLGALAQFGITGGDLTAFFLDPDVAQPLLERKYNAARISATGNRSGFGYLSEAEATDLVQIGVTEGQATAGLGELVEGKELFSPLDRGEDVISRGEQLGATFKGNANARRRIQNRAARRQAVFQQGGSFATGQNGVSGLGSAQT